MCGGQTNPNITQILLFLDDLLIVYLAIWYEFDYLLVYLSCWKGTCISIRYCISIRMIWYFIQRGGGKVMQHYTALHLLLFSFLSNLKANFTSPKIKDHMRLWETVPPQNS